MVGAGSSNAAAAPSGRFPFRGAHGCPTFEGHPTSLDRYFLDIEEIFVMLSITADDAAKINKALYYLDDATNRLWKPYATKPDGSARSWDEFKAAVMLLYPGADLQRLYSVNDLESLVLKTAARGIYTRVEYGEFFREFSLISAYLLRENRVDQRYVEKWFILAFGEDTRAKIERRLYVKHPDHHPDDPYKIEDVKAAADFLLQGNIRAITATTTADSAPGNGAATDDVKTEPTEMQRLTAQVMALTKAVSTVAHIAAQPRVPPAGTQASANAASTPDASTLPPVPRLTPFPDPANRPKGCHYCQGTHIMRDCAQFKEDLLHGRCIRNAEGKIAFWNGTVITRDYPGTTFADQVMRYNALYPPPTRESSSGTVRDPPPHIGANVVDVTDVLYADAAEEKKDTEEGWYESLDEEELHTVVTVLQNEIARKVERKKGKAVQFAGVEVPPRKTQGGTAPKPADTPPSTEGRSEVKSPGVVGPSGKGKGTAGQSDPGAQYRYQSPIENAEAAKRIMDILMEQKITVSQKDLLAAMPELRKNFKEQVSGKRVPVATSAAFEEAEVYMANYSRLPDGSVVGRDPSAPPMPHSKSQ